MSNFASALQAFQGSQIRLDELLKVASVTGQTNATDLAIARQCLEAEFRAGKLPVDTYNSLEAALNDATRLAQPALVQTFSNPRRLPHCYKIHHSVRIGQTSGLD